MIAVRVQSINKIEYNYFNKGNFSLSKIDEPPKQIQGLKSEISLSLFNLNKVFDNNLYETFLKGGEKMVSLFNSEPLKILKHKGKILNED